MPYIDDLKPALIREFGDSRFRFYQPAPHIAITRIEGRIVAEMAVLFTEVCDMAIGHEAPHIGLHDWLDVESFDMSAPGKIAAWAIPRVSKMERVIVATNNPIVGMAVRTANLTVKKIEQSSSRAELGHALKRALSGPAQS